MNLCMKIANLSLMLLCSATSANAQSGSCSEIIPLDGPRRTINLEETSSLSIIDYSIVNSALNESKSEKFDVNIIGNGSGSSSKAKGRSYAAENKNFYNLSHSKYINYKILDGDQSIIQAWTSFMSQKGGLALEMSSSDRRTISVKIYWIKPRHSDILSTRLKRDIFSDNANILENTCGLAGSEIDDNGCQITFRRKDFKEESFISVTTDNGFESAYIPPNYRVFFKEYPYSSKSLPMKASVEFPAGGGDTIQVPYKISLHRALIDRGFAISSNKVTVNVVDSTFMRGQNSGACDVASYPPTVDQNSVSGSVLIWSNKAYPAFCEISANVDVVTAVAEGESPPSME